MSELSAASILAIPESSPERLFRCAADMLSADYRDIVKIWHPDRCADPMAQDVTAHINKLHKAAKKAVKSGIWSEFGSISLKATSGKSYRMSYYSRARFELGEVLYGDTNVAFLVEKQFSDLFENAVQRIAAVSYKSEKFEKEFSRYMPAVLKTFETESACVAVLKKSPDVFSLADVLKASGGKMDPKHTAWMISALMNLNCFFASSGITHNGLSLESLFVSPKHHTILPFGGWWYSAVAGQKLRALSALGRQYLTLDAAVSKIADHRLDGLMIRAVGRQLSGSISGIGMSSGLPAPMASFLRLPASGDPIRDYQAYSEVLTQSFGARRFVELNISKSDIEKEN
jgi:hypothetical protein